MSPWKRQQNEVIMPAESFGEVVEEEELESAEPVYSEPYQVYVSCEHIYETIEEAMMMTEPSEPPPKPLSEAEDMTPLRKMRSATISRRVSRRKSFVLERECVPLQKGVIAILMGRLVDGPCPQL